MSRSVKAHCFVSLILLFLAVCSGTSGSTSSSSGTEGDATLSAQGSGRTLALIQLLGEWWNTPPQPLVVQPLLPAARPHQPWPYRPLSSAAHAAVAGTDSYALVATVQHAPLQGITSEKMVWWLNNIEGDAPYAGEGQVYSKYLQWHPRDHLYQTHVAPPAGLQPKGPLWEICEFFMCPDPAGWTAGNYQPGPQHSSDYVVREVTELQELRSHSMTLTVPTRWGIGSSLWQLRHSWQDTPDGLQVNSSQVVGVVEPGWRPLWYARWRNALVRGMFARGRDPVWMLEQWMKHCVEEMGNLEHILPFLFAAAGQAGSSGSSSRADERRETGGSALVDEL